MKNLVFSYMIFSYMNEIFWGNFKASKFRSFESRENHQSFEIGRSSEYTLTSRVDDVTERMRLWRHVLLFDSVFFRSSFRLAVVWCRALDARQHPCPGRSLASSPAPPSPPPPLRALNAVSTTEGTAVGQNWVGLTVEEWIGVLSRIKSPSQPSSQSSTSDESNTTFKIAAISE